MSSLNSDIWTITNKLYSTGKKVKTIGIYEPIKCLLEWQMFGIQDRNIALL